MFDHLIDREPANGTEKKHGSAIYKIFRHLLCRQCFVKSNYLFYAAGLYEIYCPRRLWLL